MSKLSTLFVASFVAAPGARLDADLAARALAAAGLAPVETAWLDEGVALDAFFEAGAQSPARLSLSLEAALAPHPIDVIVQEARHRRKALLVADMDSTMIAQECLDELAQAVGKGAEVAAITARAMRGEIDFEESLKTRVALVANAKVTLIQRVAALTTLNPGARALVATMRAHGAYTALVTSGFTLFAEPIGLRLGFDEVFANHLEIQEDRASGGVTPPILGAARKAEILRRLRDARGLPEQHTLAIGDGANDVDMLASAGLSVAYRAKPKVATIAAARLNHADFTALLFAQGFRRAEFAVPQDCADKS